MDEISIEITGKENLTRFHEIIEQAKSNVSIDSSALLLINQVGIERLNDFIASLSECFEELSEKASFFPNVLIQPLVDVIYSVTSLANDNPQILNHEISLSQDAQTQFNSLMDNYFREHPKLINPNVEQFVVIACRILGIIYMTIDHGSEIADYFSHAVSFLLNILKSIQ